MSRGWKEIKEDPGGLSKYNDRAKQMQNDDSQNEKTMVLKKVPKIPEFANTDSDDTDDEQGPTAKQPKKAPKTPKFVDTDSENSDDEKESVVKQPQKASKTPKFVDTSPGTENEQEPTIKQPQKANEDPQKASPAKIPNFAAAGCTFILTKGVRKGKQCRFRALDKVGKFCHHHKQT